MKIFFTLLFAYMVYCFILLIMKLMTVNEYAEYIGKSKPLVYKQIREKKILSERKFGRILIKVK